MQPSARRAALLLACAVGLGGGLGSGCVSYTATVHREVQRGALAVSVDSITGRPHAESRLLLSIDRAPSGLTLLGAYVNAPTDAPCDESLSALSFGRDGVHRADAPLTEGEQISLRLPETALDALSNRASRVDLLVRTQAGSARCIPVPISDRPQGLAFEAAQRFTLGFDLALEGFTSKLGSVSQLIAFPIMAGVWLDRVHLGAGAGPLGAGCPDSRCPITDGSDSRIDYSGGSTFVAGADTVLWEGGEIGVGASLRYRLMRLSADTFAGQDSEEFWAHGPVLAPAFLIVMPVVKPYVIGGSREALAAFEFPIGYAFTGSQGSTLTLGFVLRFRFTVL